MIYIDFQGGAHGNYLEYVCNTMLAGVGANQLPFNQHGASHNKLYQSEKKFQAGHFHQQPGNIQHSKIVSIEIAADDLLPLSLISLLRAGDYGIDNDELEINTYHKLNNESYRWVLDNIVQQYSQNQIAQSYAAVKDPTWPVVDSLAQFQALPDQIKQECLEMHKLYLLELNEHRPDCPRYVLREFFKLGFKHPEQSGFMATQLKNLQCTTNDFFVFPFGNFYRMDDFVETIDALGQWSGHKLESKTKLAELHQEFLARQPYRLSKQECDAILNKIYQQQSFELPRVDLLKESYINAQLELHYGKEMPFYQPVWFTHSDQIFEYIKA